MPRDWIEEEIGDSIPQYHPAFRGEATRSLTVRIPDELDKQMELAIQAAKEAGLPIKSYSDLIRDALFFFVRALLIKGTIDAPQLASLMEAREWSDHLDWMAKLESNAVATTKTLTKFMEQLILSGEAKIAKRYLRNHHAMVRRQPDPFVRQCYERALATNQDYARVLQSLSPPGGDPLAEETDERATTEADQSARREVSEGTWPRLLAIPGGSQRRGPGDRDK